MIKKYYEMKVSIRGTIRVPVNDYGSKGEAIECIEMTDDIADVAENIQNNHKEWFVSVDKNRVKEIEC